MEEIYRQLMSGTWDRWQW